MPFWKRKFCRIWRLFRKKSGLTRPTHGSHTAEPSIKAFLECLLLVEQNSGRTQLENAINNGQTVLLQIPAGSPSRVAVTNALALLFTDLYSQIFDIKNLKSAIRYSQEAVDLTPTGNPDRAGRLNNLSNHLNTWYKREGDLADLIQAIEYSQEAVDLTPIGNPDRTGYLNNLSNRLGTRYKREGNLKDLIQAIDQSENAIECLNSPLSIRVRGCLNAVSYLAQLQRWQEARILLDRGLEILPLLISNLSLKLDQENMMKSISGLAAIGYIVSLECSSDTFEAIRILELTRGTISRLTIDSRSDISELYRVDADLAKRFDNLRSLINIPTENRENFGKSTLPRESAVLELRDLVTQIRTKTGFEDFQDLPSKDKLLESLPDQGTVLLNTTSFRTDAILIHNVRRIEILPLNQSIFQRSKEYNNKLCDRFGYDPDDYDSTWVPANADMQGFLIWLWDQVVGPVLGSFDFGALDILLAYILPEHLLETTRLARQRQTEVSTGYQTNKLGYYQELMDYQPIIASSTSSIRSLRTRSIVRKGTTISRFPRIHWIGIGHLSAFPFHAAGYGPQDPPRNTMSCAISSYASILMTRVYAKQKPLVLEPSSSALLLVTMPETPGQGSLPGVKREAEIIQTTVQGLMPIKLHELLSVKDIAEDLPLYSSIHFACYGFADL